MSTTYQGYSFSGGMLVLLGDGILWAIIGLYCDQIVPSEFGIAKPWNFLCKCGGGRRQGWAGSESQRDTLLGQNDIGDKDVTNFEKIDDNLKK
jgi:ATP-binding cassette subfamily A (ABC1) protein 3